MQTSIKAIRRLTHALVLVSGLAFSALMPTETQAAEQMKGAQHQLHLLGVKTVGDLDNLKTDDSFAMVCAKCKTVTVTRVKRDAKGAQLLMEGGQPKEIIGTHACAGCSSTIELTGQGKGKQAALKHSCKACGDDSAFCCATKPASGPTKGMEKK